MMRPINLCSTALMLIALVLLVWQPSENERAASVPLPDLPETLGADGARVVTCDDRRIAAALAELGLPEPALFNGADPVPSGEIMKRVRAWQETGSAGALGEMGMIYLALEENKAAVSYLAAAMAGDPQNPWWVYFLGAACQKMGYREKAAALFRSFIEREPGYATAYARLGLLELEMGDLEKAEKFYAQCRDLLPRQSLAYVGLGRVYLAQSQLEPAIQNLQRAALLTPGDFMAWRFLSIALMSADRQVEARQANHKAETLPQYSGWLQFDPELARAHEMARSQRYLENSLRSAFGGNDLARAHEVVDELIRRRPGDPAMLDIKASIYLKAQDTSAALTLLDEALASHPDDAALLLNRARTLFMGGATQAALDALAEPLRLEPNNTAALDLRARALFILGRKAEAIEVMKTIVAGNPGDEGSRLALGIMCRDAGRPAQAREVFRALLQLNPNHSQARANLEKLGTD